MSTVYATDNTANYSTFLSTVILSDYAAERKTKWPAVYAANKPAEHGSFIPTYDETDDATNKPTEHKSVVSAYDTTINATYVSANDEAINATNDAAY